MNQKYKCSQCKIIWIRVNDYYTCNNKCKKVNNMKKKNLDYKVDYEIILFGVEPFTNISSKIDNFLNDINKHNLVSKYSWKIIDNTIVKHKRLKKFFRYLAKFFRYLGKKINEYRSE